jgi:DNA-binding winged helix-turn-helix (wHTH) protein/tetratricopeptide (TPR) repeat protein
VDNSGARSEKLYFGPFKLDAAQRLLIRENATFALRPKTLDVLLLLLHRCGEVVSKREIIETVWDGAAVSEYVLTTCISELRAALGEEPKRPRYLKTLHRHGYQFVGEVRDSDEQPVIEPDTAMAPSMVMVGRDRELERLDLALRLALQGQRQVVFITGEMGMGKTTLADYFVTGVAARDMPSRPLLARGQCIEQFGAGEPYMPVFEAVGRLGREPGAGFVTETLRQHAPTWLVQIPGLLPAARRIELRREFPAETQEHMLRVIADGIEALCKDHPLMLLLEDLHLSDNPTRELIAALAQRRGPARLLIIGTFRSAETFPASSSFRSLAQQLLLHRQCEEIALTPLTPDAVGAYLAGRFPGVTLPPELAANLHARTEGNPLFVVHLLDQLVEEQVLQLDREANVLQLKTPDINRRVPPNLRAMIEQRTEGLPDKQREALEVASVAGVTFWSATLAGALESDREEVEHLCMQLSRHHGFLVVGDDVDPSLPDLGASYTFRHGLYRQVLYERIEPSRRQRLHRAIAAALQTAWAERAGDIAAELAWHFEYGGSLPNAIEFYDKAAAAAARQAANREAVGHLDHALALLRRNGRGPQQRELDLLMSRGLSVLAVAGYGSQAVLDNFEQALDLARQLDNPMRQLSCLVALSTCQQTRGNLAAGEAFARELVRVAEQMRLPPPFVAQLHNPLSQARLYQGAVEEALALADAAVAAMEVMPLPLASVDDRPALWADPRVMLYCQRGAASFACGRLAQAGAALDEALRIAREMRHPFNLAYAHAWQALYEDLMGRFDAAIRAAQQAMVTAHACDLTFWEGVGTIVCGHAMACNGEPERGVALLREGIALWSGTGGRIAAGMYYNLLADAYLLADDTTAARAALAESQAHAERSGEMVFLAETLRLQAECLRREGVAAATVDEPLQQAIAIARRQGAKLWELRARLARHLLQRSGSSRRDLAAICRELDGEPDTHDLLQVRSALTASSLPRCA